MMWQKSQREPFKKPRNIRDLNCGFHFLNVLFKSNKYFNLSKYRWSGHTQIHMFCHCINNLTWFWDILRQWPLRKFKTYTRSNSGDMLKYKFFLFFLLTLKFQHGYSVSLQLSGVLFLEFQRSALGILFF